MFHNQFTFELRKRKLPVCSMDSTGQY